MHGPRKFSETEPEVDDRLRAAILLDRGNDIETDAVDFTHARAPPPPAESR
jgi:hypothetical protein